MGSGYKDESIDLMAFSLHLVIMALLIMHTSAAVVMVMHVMRYILHTGFLCYLLNDI